MVDTRDLKSLGLFRAGSNPAGGTKLDLTKLIKLKYNIGSLVKEKGDEKST